MSPIDVFGGVQCPFGNDAWKQESHRTAVTKGILRVSAWACAAPGIQASAKFGKIRLMGEQGVMFYGLILFHGVSR
ncbi:hypothetical protein [Desulfosoma sp.]